MTARNTITIDAPPAAVAAVLADPAAFPRVAADRPGNVEGPWPEVGAVCRLPRGVGPLQTADVMRVTSRRRYGFSVEGGVRGVLTGTITIDVQPAGDGRTVVRLAEEPTGGLARYVPGLQRLLQLRDGGVLRRLRDRATAQPVPVTAASTAP